jgi:2'-5' RNA ligase
VSDLRPIGVAIAIPEPYGSELQSWRAHFGDPQASAIPSHVTLLPPSTIADGELTTIDAHLRSVAQAQSRFDIHLRGTGTFRPVSPVVFVQLVEGISGCERVERAVRSGPLERELKFNYHPHVTVAHDLPEPVLDEAFDQLGRYEARFTVWGFSLYEHGPDGVWRPQRDYPFGQPLPGRQAAI